MWVCVAGGGDMEGVQQYHDEGFSIPREFFLAKLMDRSIWKAKISW